MTTYDSDTTLTVCGVHGRLTHRTTKPGQAPGLWFRQRWISEGRRVLGYGEPASMQVEMRFDDDPSNGHNTFAITAEVQAERRTRRDNTLACGCMHDEIAKAFPELAHLIRWHLVSTDGPTRYIANTVYLAGDRDHRGKRSGEPYAWDEAVKFGAVPILHTIKGKLAAFLREVDTYDRDGKVQALNVIAVPYKPASTDYKLGPKYQFAGQPPLKWHECPFDAEDDAARFAAAFIDHAPEFHRVPTLFSEGKARELDKARSVAVWPEATDEELTREPDELRSALAARLPALLKAFRTDMEAIGFLWSPEDYRAEGA